MVLCGVVAWRDGVEFLWCYCKEYVIMFNVTLECGGV